MLSEKKPDQLDQTHTLTYGQRSFSEEVPKYTFPEKAIPPSVAYQIVHDELNLDANPALNLASFVTTWMEPEAEKLMTENLHKNYIDHDEYPQTEMIQSRCVHMLADLFNIPSEAHFMGTATIGSSEAIMLALLAHKWNWKKRREQKGLSTAHPNVIFGAHVHVCWEKFARYFDVEMRLIPVRSDCYTLDPKEVEKRVDENTIAVGAIVGSTYTGDLDPLDEINALLERIKKEKGWDIPMHVDGASGGFVLPFTKPSYQWDFRLSRVKSINVSGHKFGLVYPGVGWLIWKDREEFPQELIYNVDYLGEWMPTYTLNFSRGSSSILGQYYNFLRLGKEGYTQVMQNCLNNANYLSQGIEKRGLFSLIHGGETLPIVVFKLKNSELFTPFDLSEKLRSKGWVVPAYTLPKNAETVAVMRVVVKENFSRDMADLFLEHLDQAVEVLQKQKTPAQKRTLGIC